MAARVTQTGIEVYTIPPSNALVTQVAIEFYYQINAADAQVTQVAAETLARNYFVDDGLNQNLLLTAPSAYPLPAAGGPQYSMFLKLADEYAVTTQEFKTGNRHYNLDTSERIVRWKIRYDFLTEDEMLLLDAHWLSAKGQFFGFDFTDPRASITYQNAHYAPDSWTAGKHVKRWSPKREILIEWRSATGSIVAPEAGDGWDSDTWDVDLFGG